MSNRFNVCGPFLALLLTSSVLQAAGEEASRVPSESVRPTLVRKTIYGFKGGLFGSGDVTVKNGGRLETQIESGFSLAAFVDFRTVSKTSIGLSVEMHRIKPEILDISKNMIDFSVNLKGAFYTDRSRVIARPCLALGFGMLGGGKDGWFTAESSNYFIVKGALEVLLMSKNGRTGIMGEVGMIAAPWGKESGGGGHTLSAAPRLLARLGLALR